MSHFKNLAIDKMNQLKFEVYILRADGPDDCEWEFESDYDSLSEATKRVIELEDCGYSSKLFDPFVGEYYNIKGETK
jgi:hypothetical protein